MERVQDKYSKFDLWGGLGILRIMSEIRTQEHKFENLNIYQAYIHVRNSVTFSKANTEFAGKPVSNSKVIITSLAVELERIMRMGERHVAGPGSG